MKNKLRDFEIKNKNDLKDGILKIWNEIPKNFCKKLVMSVKRRIQEVIKAKGGHINY